MAGKARFGSLIRNARRIAETTGKGLIRIAQAQEEVSDEELRERIKLAETIRRLALTEDFAVFNADAWKKIGDEKDRLIAMKPEDFEGPAGMELKGFIRGWQKAFGRLRDIKEAGRDAELKMQRRIADANEDTKFSIAK